MKIRFSLGIFLVSLLILVDIFFSFFLFFYLHKNFLDDQNRDEKEKVVQCLSWDTLGPKFYEVTPSFFSPNEQFFLILLDYFVENTFLYYYNSPFQNKSSSYRALSFIASDYRKDFTDNFIKKKIKHANDFHNTVIIKRRRKIHEGAFLYIVQENVYDVNNINIQFNIMEVTIMYRPNDSRFFEIYKVDVRSVDG